MAARKPAAKGAKGSATTSKRKTGFTDEERGAMRERVKELKGESDGDEAVLAKIAKMGPADRSLGEKIHSIVRAHAPALTPKLWYGMPAYAKDGKVVVFFQDAQKFKARYATLGFSDQANLDEGTMWASAFALTKLTASNEKTIAALVKKAVRAR